MVIRFIPTDLLRPFGALIVCAMVVAPDAVGAQGGILQSTYLGGVGHTDGRVVAVDPSNGDVLVAGSATVGDIPATAGGAQTELSGPQDGWVARLSADLRTVKQATYLGGSGFEQVDAIAVDPDTGDVLAAGYTSSDDFPATAGGAQEQRSGASDAFVARLSGDLTTFRQVTYLGGSGDERGPALGLAIDSRSGDVLVTGNTTSTDFPARAGSAQPTCSGNECADGFVARLTGDLKSVKRSTYLGGIREDGAYDIAIHPRTGDLLIAGDSMTGNSARVGVVACYNGALTVLRGLTRLGTRAWGVIVDPVSGDVIAAGETGSTLAGTEDAAQPEFGGGNSDAFVARFNADLFLRQATYLGGSGDEGGMVTLALCPDTGEVIVAGMTSSGDFPSTAGGAQAVPSAAPDGFVARLAGDLSLLDQASYLGGGGSDSPARVRVTSDGAEVVVAGSTTSPDFPATDGGAQPSLPTPSGAEPSAAFATRIDPALTGPPATPTATATAELTPTVPAGSTPTGTATDRCMGDCAGDRAVTVDDLIKGVNIALDNAAVATCAAFDPNGDGRVTIDELIGAVNSALNGCA